MEFNVSGAFALGMLISTSCLVATIEKGEKEGKECIVLSWDLQWPHRFERHEIAQGFFNIEDPTSDILLRILQSISPMLLQYYFGGAARVQGKKADVTTDELIQWLDSQSESSVVYVLFGSQILFTEPQRIEG
ncbi:hypothetical protein SUGI_0074560 [Cryptomeria japonica]|nr:hypothetical protein SUGI_0074560 [Cryptomeria japonica]